MYYWINPENGDIVHEGLFDKDTWIHDAYLDGYRLVGGTFNHVVTIYNDGGSISKIQYNWKILNLTGDRRTNEISRLWWDKESNMCVIDTPFRDYNVISSFPPAVESMRKK